MLVLDGSRGEGGGQILRTALALSLITGHPFQLKNIRAKRKNPGLQKQHLTCVQAAQVVGAADVMGAEIHSPELQFNPQTLSAGKYYFSTGGAGSTMLVLQTILPALCHASQSSEIVLEGGTHNPLSPPFPFIAQSFLPLLKQMGVEVSAHLERPGFFPKGGGRCRFKVVPSPLQPLELPPKQVLHQRQGKILLAKLPQQIAEREKALLESVLGWPIEIELLPPAYGPGNVILLEVQGNLLCQIETGFGMRGVQAEKLVKELIQRIQTYLVGPPVGEYLADQLLLPLALAGQGHFFTGPLSLHTTTNLETIQAFLGVCFEVEEVEKQLWRIALKT